MANYAYALLPRLYAAVEIEHTLRSAVADWFRGTWEVEAAPWTPAPGYIEWSVVLPGAEREADYVGFLVERTPAPYGDGEITNAAGVVAFRHGFAPFARWAQGCIEEELAERLKAPLLFDATGQVFLPGIRRYRKHGTDYRGYLAAGLKKPLSREDARWIEERYQQHVPARWMPPGVLLA